MQSFFINKNRKKLSVSNVSEPLEKQLQSKLLLKPLPELKLSHSQK